MRALSWIVAALLAFGTAYRLWPVAAGMPALSTYFVTEDGYLLLTVARNLGIGQGMTVSDGTIATNGIQPLVTFLFTIPYWLSGGDKVAGLQGMHLISAAVALGAAFAIRAIAGRILADLGHAPAWGWAVALLWFLGPVPLLHSMNGLETGLVTLMLAVTLWVFHRRLAAGREAGLALDLGLGAMAGLTILSRIDTGPTMVALFAIWAAIVLWSERTPARVLTRILPAGLVTTLIAGPWFVRNLIVFGSIMPSSGTSQRLDAVWGENLDILPAKAFELAFPMLPVPSALETAPWMQLVCTLAILAVVAALLARLLAVRAARPTTAATVVWLIHAAFTAFYYAMIFGTAHFLSRYLAPVSPVMILGALVLALWLARPLGMLYAAGGLAVAAALLLALLGPLHRPQGHEQTIAWMQANVDDATWIGAPQTGTLGYWHDRTINLDGKVNPTALARRERGEVLDYVVESEIDYVIDWAGVGGWIDMEAAQGEGGFAETFELLLRDEARNLSVMARRDR